jgi:hypothetical protein
MPRLPISHFEIASPAEKQAKPATAQAMPTPIRSAPRARLVMDDPRAAAMRKS